MNLSENYKITNDELNVIVNELKEVTIKDKKDKKDTDDKSIKKTKKEWKVIGYFSCLEASLKFLIQHELIKAADEEMSDIINRIEELKLELPKITLELSKNIVILDTPDKKKNKKKKQVEEEIKITSDFLEEIED